MNKKITPLSNQCEALILGTLLGDGSMSLIKPYKEARFSFKHSIKQKEYFFWKVSLLSEISSDKCYWTQSGKNEGYGIQKLRYQSRALPQLTDIYRLVYKQGKKKVTRKWLNQLTPLSLAAWWFDDGSLVSNTRKGVFCTDSYSIDEVRIIQRYFHVVWDIDTKIFETNVKKNGVIKHYYRLSIYSSIMLKKFLRIIIPFVPVESMLYKVCILYKDSDIQQRWISEMAKLSNFDQLLIQQLVEIRKLKLKAFQRKI